MSDEEYNGGYKRIYGVQFKQPESNNFGLNEESILDDWFLVAITLLSGIPVIGIAFIIPSMMVGLEDRHENPFCLNEQLWKAGVFGTVFQIIGLAIFGLLLLV